MRQRETIADQWEKFRSHVVPFEANADQITEYKNSFYAGAAALHKLLLTQMDDGEATEADAAYLEQIDTELRTHLEDLMARYRAMAGVTIQ